MLKVNKSYQRGSTKIDWLESYHGFSFGNYYDPAKMAFGPIRVFNDDYISASGGFPTHPHANMEIITYVISGSLEHADSTGTNQIIEANELQKMTAGFGVQHSEFNPSDKDDVHLLQIWIMPDTKGLTPSYQKLNFADTNINNQLVKVAAKENQDGVIYVSQNIEVFLSKLLEKNTLLLENKNRQGIYIFCIDGVLSINGHQIDKGDSVEITYEEILEIKAKENSHFILFEFPL
ncbi:MAG: pirin family protein [bacterium]